MFLGSLLVLPSAQAATITATINGDPIATVPISVTVNVTGAPIGTELWTTLYPAAPDMVPYPGVDPTQCPHDRSQYGYLDGFWGYDHRSASVPDFTFMTTLGQDNIAGPLRLCVKLVDPPDRNNNYGPPLADFSAPFTARAPRGSLRLSRPRWSSADRRLTFRYSGASEGVGEVDRYLLPARRGCPANAPRSLDQSPADLGSTGPPATDLAHFVPGTFRHEVKVRWRRRFRPPPGRYRICAYLISEAGTTELHYSLIQMARARARIRVTR